jgi:tetratricopeptide (TPR) repeat protein
MTEDGNQEAIRLLREAVRIDPVYATAQALLAWCLTLRVAQGWVGSMEEEAKEGLEAARLAINAAENDPEPLWFSGYAYAYFGGDLEGGLRLIEQALELDPNAAQAWVFSGWINMYLGKAERSVEHFQQAMRLNPLDPAAYRTHAGLAFAYLFLREFDDAITWGTKALQENERWTATHRVLAASLALAGRSSEAQNVVKSLRELVPNLTVSKFMAETRFRFPAYFDLLMDGMRKAGLPE